MNVNATPSHSRLGIGPLFGTPAVIWLLSRLTSSGVREAEAVLHVASAETGGGVASFYPDVSLSGLSGTEGLSPGSAWVRASRAFEVGRSISVPIFRVEDLGEDCGFTSRSSVRQFFLFQ